VSDRGKMDNAALILRKGLYIIALAWVIFFIAGCAAKGIPQRQRVETRGKELARMGYTVQVGAFSKVENASRLTDTLRSQGIGATYFVAEKGLYKVRFGNFPSRAAAINKAESLKAARIIEEFYIVSPGEYAVAKKELGSAYLREEIVKTARSFIGVPYLWGGADADTGFDCSGLTMTIYQLNGLDLPRTSLEQADAGVPVDRDNLSKGDLIFFRTTGIGKVSHVGIYTGNGLFIHAPGKGKNIRLDHLSRDYYRQRYAGARTYM
jgi:hypothetical protein